MECLHCYLNASPTGKHMKRSTFLKAIDFSAKYDHISLLLSGGEPSDHPLFLEFLEIAHDYKKRDKIILVSILSNGMFLEDERYTKEILKFNFPIQITNDPRYYPKRIKKINDPNIAYEDHVRFISPSKKAAKNNIPINRQSPLCFNFRSTIFSLQDIIPAIATLRYKLKFCTPSININGDVVAGEFDYCYKIGTVESNKDELLNNIKNMSCGKCGLHKNLTGKYAELWNSMESQ